MAVDRYDIVSKTETAKSDVRSGKEGEVATKITAYQTTIDSCELDIQRGDFCVSLDQPLANLILAACEPEGQHSFASNALLDPLSLFRLPKKPENLHEMTTSL